MSIEDEFTRMLGAQAAASDQLRSEMANVAALLGLFRAQLIANNFSTAGAEDLTLEWYVRLLDGSGSSDDD